MALPEFINLNISKIITHEIFKRDDQKQIVEPKLNDELTILNDDGLSILTERIVAAIGQDSKSIEMNIVNTGVDSTSKYVEDIFNQSNDDNFIQNSKNITNKLVQAQTSRSYPGGVIIILKGTSGYEESDLMLIIKAELQSGFKKSNNSTIEYVNDLLLTPQQKMYKIGAFLRKNNKTRAFVYDYNISKSEEQGLAQYFYGSFLGLEMLHTNKYFTSKFYYGTKEFINSLETISDENKYDLNTHLYSYMKSDTLTTISLKEFSDSYIAGADMKDAYISYMKKEVFKDDSFNRSITKDITDIKSKLKIRKMVFTSGIKISGISDNFDNKVKIINQRKDKDGNIIDTTLKIIGMVKGIE
ncbi:hypothetical protein O8C89_03190 [Aliarcobacter butzleri]|uniref:hypothetical protein n=1 Tax=Aliarcobacter butzleri TaxID=28197 RepID=UPI00263CB96E|nr:hypothetical protein [Aliarcobacter butzleri]MDN5079522.1 hypothetical protein [Aliarcobacter butzleri]